MMRIAVDCRLIGQSGIGTFIENVVHYMVKTEDVDFVLIGNRDKLAVYSERANCLILECNYGSFTFKELFCFPTKEVNKCDAFFTPNFNIPMGIHVPIFSTIHDVVFFDVKGICSPTGKLIRFCYMWRALKLSKKVFTVSNFSKDRIDAIFHPSCPVIVCYSGISEKLVEYAKTHASCDRKQQVVFLGNLKKQKGLSTLIKAWNMAKEHGLQGMKMVVIGNVDFKTKDNSIIQLLNEHHEDITFLRNATDQQVYDTLRESLALVSPSLYEGLGLPPMEAMYLGTQAIISDIPVYQEIYSTTNAIFFPVGNVEALAKKLLHITGEKGVLSAEILKRHKFETITSVIAEHIYQDNILSFSVS